MNLHSQKALYPPESTSLNSLCTLRVFAVIKLAKYKNHSVFSTDISALSALKNVAFS